MKQNTTEEKKETCWHVECDNVGVACFLGTDDEPNGYYCSEHAYDNGFCSGCGNFWAGVSSFDFSPTELCENCQSGLSNDDDDDDDDLEGWDELGDY